mmetsp:Transcript_9244/g.24968  ORF Transcript_9244/g.24968 Transcript_9244/m.24968 type:complete len:267 (+) Transcript_9244:61-861(+)
MSALSTRVGNRYDGINACLLKQDASGNDLPADYMVLVQHRALLHTQSSGEVGPRQSLLAVGKLLQPPAHLAPRQLFRPVRQNIKENGRGRRILHLAGRLRHERPSQRRGEIHLEDGRDEFVLRHGRNVVAVDRRAPLGLVLFAQILEFALLVRGDPLGSAGRLVGHLVSAIGQTVFAVLAGRVAAHAAGIIEHDVLFGQTSEQLDGFLGFDGWHNGCCCCLFIGLRRGQSGRGRSTCDVGRESALTRGWLECLDVDDADDGDGGKQ